MRNLNPHILLFTLFNALNICSTGNTVFANSDESQCFMFQYPERENFIPDPYCSDVSLYFGWGGENRFVNYDPDFIYCGEASIGVNSPWKGTLETSNLRENTIYRIKAKVFTPNDVVSRISMYNHGFSSNDLIYFLSSKENEWEDFDCTFRTGPNGGTIYFVGDNGDGIVYIDNYEAYIVDEPYVVISYVDENGDQLKDERYIYSDWGIDVSKYITIGKKFEQLENSDFSYISKDGVDYLFNKDLSDLNKVIDEGENVITLVFSVPKGMSNNANLENIEFSIGSLYPKFNPEITEYKLRLPSLTDIIDPEVFLSERTQVVSGDEAVDLSSGSGMSEIKVIAEDGITEKIYTIKYTVVADDESFVPTYSDKMNVNNDVFCSDISFYSGWGGNNRFVNNDYNFIYSGETSIGVVSPWGGTLEVIDFYPNQCYRVIAKVYPTKGTLARFALFNHGLGSEDIVLYDTSSEEEWEFVDFTFRTTDQGGKMYFVGEIGSGHVYIDNFEIYTVDEPSILVKYLDVNSGLEIKSHNNIYSDWGYETENYIHIGDKYIISEDDLSFNISDNKYIIDNTKDYDYSIKEGENVIELFYTQNNPSSVVEINGAEIINIEYFTLDGIKLNKETVKGKNGGIHIEKVTYSNGTIKVNKFK